MLSLSLCVIALLLLLVVVLGVRCNRLGRELKQYRAQAGKAEEGVETSISLPESPQEPVVGVNPEPVLEPEPEPEPVLEPEPEAAAEPESEPEPAPESHEALTNLVDEALVARAEKYVEDHLERSDLSVEELSHELGISRVYLYKKLVATTGKTPIEFIRILRLKRAAQLLRESRLNVSEIAYQVGFNNPKYFSKYFKEEYGVLPSAYQHSEVKNT